MELLGMKKMPNLVGKSVTHAKLTLPTATQYVFVDHKSRNPGIVFNSNWKICKQEPAAGAQLSGYVVLTVIKRGETCKVSH
jgi:beta-lactam-binding protein with PASTA domain